jgi:hypothetical protein
MDRIYWASQISLVKNMTHDTKKDEGSPKFGRLLIVLAAAVAFCGLLTYVMGTLYPGF